MKIAAAYAPASSCTSRGHLRNSHHSLGHLPQSCTDNTHPSSWARLSSGSILQQLNEDSPERWVNFNRR